MDGAMTNAPWGSGPTKITSRPITDDDLEVLAEIYASTRREEVAQVPWTEAEREAFLRSQFDAQHAHYQTHYPDADFLLLLRDGEPIGRFYVDRWEDQIRLVDIALLPAARGSGVGTLLLESLMAEATAARKPITIHVETNNPAMRLYQRLGFRKIEDKGVYHLMEWRPPTS